MSCGVSVFLFPEGYQRFFSKSITLWRAALFLALGASGVDAFLRGDVGAGVLLQIAHLGLSGVVPADPVAAIGAGVKPGMEASWV